MLLFVIDWKQESLVVLSVALRDGIDGFRGVDGEYCLVYFPLRPINTGISYFHSAHYV